MNQVKWFTAERKRFNKRQADTHKGTYGRVLAIGGSAGMEGAICLSAEAAARVGVGSVVVGTFGEHIASVLREKPDFMVFDLEDDGLLSEAIDAAVAILIGPGLGRSERAQLVLEKVLAAGKPCVVDADALTLLANKELECPHGVLTPHPGEAATLLGKECAWVQANRPEALAAIASKTNASVVLKGSGTLISSRPTHDQEDNNLILGCHGGNPGMAVAGMGDVLAGMILGYLGLGYAMSEAIVIAVHNHASLADNLVSQHGEAGLMASDMLANLSLWVSG